MYFIIESKPSSHSSEAVMSGDHNSRVEITRTAPRDAATGNIALDGPYKTENDTTFYSHGYFSSEEKAASAINDKFGPLREFDSSGSPFKPSSDSVVATFETGQYDNLTLDETIDFVSDAAKQDISLDMSESEILKLSEKYSEDAKEYGKALHPELPEYLSGELNGLRADAELQEDIKNGDHYEL